MSFYLKPPRGEIHLEKASHLARKRLQFLSLIPKRDIEATSPADFAEILQDRSDLHEAVAEGTPKDRVSHYFLRLTAAAARSYSFDEFLLDSESQLFALRAADRPRTILVELERHIKALLLTACNLDADLRSVHNAVVDILDEDVLCPTSGKVAKVPFQLVPALVGQRRVPVENGLAVIDAEAVGPFLRCIFRHFLVCGIRAMRSGNPLSDDRTQDLVGEVLTDYRRIHIVEGTAATANGLPPLLARLVPHVARDAFPPCFSRAQLRLSRVHRLGHHARVAYTLFLKEVGLSHAEALAFWSWHYSRHAIPSSEAGCSHSWKKDMRRYVYSIGHLYGLEGSRRNYSAHSCAAIRSMGESSPSVQIACPFTTFDEESLRQTLLASQVSEQCADEIVLKSRSTSGDQAACGLYLKARLKNSEVGISSFTKPSQFYKMVVDNQSLT